jgi:hypothetical protein
MNDGTAGDSLCPRTATTFRVVTVGA